MGRLIDADAFMKAMYHRAFETDVDTMWQSGCWVRYRAVEQTVREQPTVDAVPVIRCKDCRYWDEFPSSSIAPEFHKCKGLGVHTVADFFCKKGERKADE